MTHLWSSRDDGSGSRGIVAHALSSARYEGDPQLLVAQRTFRGLRSHLAEMEAITRTELIAEFYRERERMLYHFNIEKRIFAETDMTMCIYHERSQRKEITQLQQLTFQQLKESVLANSTPQLLILTQAMHTRRACFIWLAQSLSRAELYRRMNVIVREELVQRRQVTRLFYLSLGAGGAQQAGLASTAMTEADLAAAAEQASKLLLAQRAHESAARRMESLEQERAAGITAAKVHALLSAQHAARTRLVWDEEMDFRQILRLT